MMTALLDTSFLLAAAFERDRNHVSAASALRALSGDRIVVSPVVIELFFMTSARISYQRAIQLFSLLQSSAFTIVSLTAEDRIRITELMR